MTFVFPYFVVQLPDFSNIRVPRNVAGPSQSRTPAPSARPVEEDPAHLMQMIMANPAEKGLLRERNPPLYEAIEEGNLRKWDQ